jgi:signal transduction histidine kinase/DNA-binding response OmpR family regulator/CHASE3 domain sensor protein
MVSSIASFIGIRSLLESNTLVNHTKEIIYNLNEGASSTVEAQTKMRGFLVTGREDFLDHFDEIEENAKIYFDKVEELTAESPVQRNSIRELKPLVTKLFIFLRYRISDKRVGTNIQSYDLDTGKILMDNITIIIKKIEKHEQELLADRTATSEEYGMYSSILIIIAFLVAILISVFMLIRILKDYNVRTELQIELEKRDIETAARIKTISTIASQLSQGNYDIRVDDQQSDALGKVGESLNNMSKSLSQSFHLLSEKEWLQAGIAQLNKIMLGEKKLNVLAKDVIEYVSTYTKSSAGLFYVIEGDELYHAAGFSYIPNKNRQRFKIGQGITGQAAVSKKIIELKTITKEDIMISYALGEVKPSHVVAVPLQDNKIEGVMELASLKGYSAIELEFLEIASVNIGIVVKATQNRKRVQELLEETQSQSEELRVQHSEMEAVNAELEIQTEKLQASEEELRVQQEELQQTNEELAHRSHLLEDKNAEILKKSEDLELTTRYKSEFLANMSHELRTPLNSILLLSRLLSENNDRNMNSEQIEFAQVIQSSGNGLLGLIDEILDLSKIESGKMDLEFVDVEINDISQGLHDLFTEVAKDKKIGFEIITKEVPSTIKTDKMRLEQILKNLISNALKFTSTGSVTLEIKTDDKNENTICFIVKDTGIGIPLDKQPLIFEAFQQADGSTKRKYGGTGLGLSISRELAKLLQGEISLKSEVGKGSEFMLCVSKNGVTIETIDEIIEDTIVEIAQPAIDFKLESESTNQYLSQIIPDAIDDDRESITSKDKVILIVEDDTNFAKSLLNFTRKSGYKGVVTVRGDFAINDALLYNPVGILLDIQLPVKNGWQVMEELKGNWKTKHIPVHIMSSNKVKQESLLKGAVNFIDKPFALEKMPDVFKHIEQILNKQSQKVLIIEDNSKHAEALAYFLDTNNIKSEIKTQIAGSIDALTKDDVDCVILDMGVPDVKAYDILEQVKKNAGLAHLPIIVFTGKSLSLNEELRIKKYADSIVVKTAHSYQRMLDEVSLFLHLMEEKKDENGKKDAFKKPNMLNNILKGKTVLVVDDDVRNIYSLTKALEVYKMNVITAIDGREALKVLAENPKTSIVLLDMMMPNLDGYETAAIIRKNETYKNLPIIAVTAKAMTGDREKCIQAGASDYITKPVDSDQLLSLLRVWLYDKL